MAASGTAENPNTQDVPEVVRDQQVMVSPRAAAAQQIVDPQAPVMNGVGPPLRGSVDIDDEVRLPRPMMTTGNMPVNASNVTGENGQQHQQPRAELLSEGASRGFGVSSGRVENAHSDFEPAPSNVFSGMLRAVQNLPTTVESFVRTTGGSISGNQQELRDSVEYASVTSSGENPKRGRPPSAAQVPETPLFDLETMRRFERMEAQAPLLFPTEAVPQPAPPAPPSVTSSDVQAEVRRQLVELMALRDEDGRRLRAQVEALAVENSELRARMFNPVQSRTTNTRVESVSQGFAGFGWIGRGIGSLMGSGRALDLRPQVPNLDSVDRPIAPCTPLLQYLLHVI